MKSAPALLLALFVLLVATPALADCTSTQGATVNASIGIDGVAGAQGACIPGDPGQPGGLIGFAFKLVSCEAAFVKKVGIHFQVADAGDQYRHYLWRNLGGIPNDACGLE